MDAASLGNISFWSTGEYWHETILIHDSNACEFHGPVSVDFPGGIGTPPTGYGRARALRVSGNWITFLPHYNQHRFNRLVDYVDFDLAHGMGVSPTIIADNLDTVLISKNATEFGDVDFHANFMIDTFGIRPSAIDVVALRLQGITNLSLAGKIRNNADAGSALVSIEKQSGGQTGRGWGRFENVSFVGTERVKIAAPFEANFDGHPPKIEFADPDAVVFHKGGGTTRKLIAASKFAWQNQDTATITNLPHGALRIGMNGVGYGVGNNEVRFAWFSPGSTNWFVTAEIDATSMALKNWLRGGIAVRNSSTGVIYTFHVQSGSGGLALVSQQWTNLVALDAEPVFVQAAGTVHTIRVEHSSGELRFDIVRNGATIDRIGIISASGFDEIGLFVNAENEGTPNRPVSIDVLDFNWGAL
jgi:hypothetical protein